MAISVAGTASGSGTSVALPAHQPKDMLVFFAKGIVENIPVVPSSSGQIPSWSIARALGRYNISINCAYTIAVASNHTSGNWTNATHIGVLVLRSSKILSVGPSSENGQAGYYIGYPALTLAKTDGSSMGLRVGARPDYLTAPYLGTPPPGWTNQIVVPTGNSMKMGIHTRAALTANMVDEYVNTPNPVNDTGWQIAFSIEIIETTPTEIVSIV